MNDLLVSPSHIAYVAIKMAAELHGNKRVVWGIVPPELLHLYSDSNQPEYDSHRLVQIDVRENRLIASTFDVDHRGKSVVEHCTLFDVTIHGDTALATVDSLLCDDEVAESALCNIVVGAKWLKATNDWQARELYEHEVYVINSGEYMEAHAWS